MSFGFGIGDLFLCIKGLWKVTDLLRGEAIAGFKQYRRMYRELKSLAEFLCEFVEESDEQYRALFKNELLAIHRLLERFFSRINALYPYLGHRRLPRSFLGAIAKISWPRHSKKLAQLHQDLLFQISLISTKEIFRPQDPLLRNGFILEDAKGGRCKINFASISSWEHMHEYLLRIFPANDPGHLAIRHQSYLFYKTNSDKDILCSDPCLKPFRDVILRDDFIQMSILFPHDESYDSKCPKCCKARPADFRGASLKCDACKLVLRFRDSYDNEPDPLTRIALDGIRSTGMRDFFLNGAKIGTRRSRRGPEPTNIGRNHNLGALCKESLEDLDSSYKIFSLLPRPTIADFSSVTLCTARWPELFHHKSHQNGIEQLSRTMRGLRKTLSNIKNEDMPFAMAAAALNTRFWGARYMATVSRFLESVLHAYRERGSPMTWAQVADDSVRSYISRTDGMMASFHPSTLRIRCLAWIHWDILALQGRILRASSAILRSFEGFERQETPLFVKLFTLPHIALLPVWRVTFDVVHDCMDLLSAEKPFYLIPAVRHLVRQSAEISLHYHLDGDLTKHFKEVRVREEDLKENSVPAFRRWIETVARGDMDPQSIRDLHSCMEQ